MHELTEKIRSTIKRSGYLGREQQVKVDGCLATMTHFDTTETLDKEIDKIIVEWLEEAISRTINSACPTEKQHIWAPNIREVLKLPQKPSLEEELDEKN